MYLRALRIAMIWLSFVNGFASCASRAAICARMAAASSGGASGASLLIPATSSSRWPATTKSSPCRLNASTGSGRILFSTRWRTNSRLSPLVMSGFCSEPDRPNSFRTILCVVMNHEWSYARDVGRPAQMLERRERVEAGQARIREAPAERVEPQRRRAGKDADRVARPDRDPSSERPRCSATCGRG